MSEPRVIWLEDDPRGVVTLARDVLKSEQVIVFPSDTVYGLMAWPKSAEAFHRIYELKQREESKPLALLVGWGSRSFGQAINRVRHGLGDHDHMNVVNKFREGHLTVILPNSVLPDLPVEVQEVQPGSIGLRCPCAEPLRSLLCLTGDTLWATSVNRSGEPPATTADEVLAWLDELRELGTDPPALIVLSRETGSGQPSGVVDLSGDEPVRLR